MGSFHSDFFITPSGGRLEAGWNLIMPPQTEEGVQMAQRACRLRHLLTSQGGLPAVRAAGPRRCIQQPQDQRRLLLQYQRAVRGAPCDVDQCELLPLPRGQYYSGSRGLLRRDRLDLEPCADCHQPDPGMVQRLQHPAEQHHARSDPPGRIHIHTGRVVREIGCEQCTRCHEGKVSADAEFRDTLQGKDAQDGRHVYKTGTGTCINAYGVDCVQKP